jgi:alpha-D-ribose 1-methylphosphonate 5-triphosphate synthase subunit PhnH
LIMIGPAFLDAVLDAQATFRAVLGAMARPGTVAQLKQPSDAPPPLAAGAAAIALTLCDQDTAVWLDPPLRASSAVLEWLRFHTAARLVEKPDSAAFAFVGVPDQLPPFDRFSLGTPEYPDRSTTIVLQVETLREGRRLFLRGPGIRGQRSMQAAPLPPDLPERLAANRRLFPRGIDLLFAAEAEVMALPRSVHVTAGDR